MPNKGSGFQGAGERRQISKTRSAASPELDCWVVCKSCRRSAPYADRTTPGAVCRTHWARRPDSDSRTTTSQTSSATPFIYFINWSKSPAAPVSLMPEASTTTAAEAAASKAEVPAAPTVAEIVAKLDDKQESKKKEEEKVEDGPVDETKPQSGLEKSDVEKHLDEHGWAIHHHPTLPYSYKLTRHGKIYTVVQRLGPTQERINIRRSVQKKWASLKRLLPLFIRFTKETSLPLGKRRIMLCKCSLARLRRGCLMTDPTDLLGNILLSILPSLQSRANWALTELTRKAIETRTLDKTAIAKAAAFDIACHLLEKIIKEPIEENKAR